MVNGIGNNGGGMARDAIRAALQRQAETMQRFEATSESLSGASSGGAVKDGFGSSLAESVKDVNHQIQLGDQLVEGIVSGQVTDLHEIAAQVKTADLSFKFALAVRNKFIDAYREVMRMSV